MAADVPMGVQEILEPGLDYNPRILENPRNSWIVALLEINRFMSKKSQNLVFSKIQEFKKTLEF